VIGSDATRSIFYPCSPIADILVLELSFNMCFWPGDKIDGVDHVCWSWYDRCTKAGGIEIRPISEHQNYNLENVHITTATLIKFAQKIMYQLISFFSKAL
jgi:hypothetical protein